MILAVPEVWCSCEIKLPLRKITGAAGASETSVELVLDGVTGKVIEGVLLELGEELGLELTIGRGSATSVLTNRSQGWNHHKSNPASAAEPKAKPCFSRVFVI